LAQQELEQPVSLALNVLPGVLAATDEIPQRLLGLGGDADRGELPRPEEPRQLLGIAAVGLDPIWPRFHRD
jgi:hypothetical protein